jgi:hypothetical protein
MDADLASREKPSMSRREGSLRDRRPVVDPLECRFLLSGLHDFEVPLPLPPISVELGRQTTDQPNEEAPVAVQASTGSIPASLDDTSANDLDWASIARLAKGWASPQELALARQFIDRLDGPEDGAGPESGRLYLDVVTSDAGLAALAAELKGRLDGQSARVASGIPARPEGPSVAYQVKLTSSQGMAEATVTVSASDGSGKAWAPMGKFSVAWASAKDEGDDDEAAVTRHDSPVVASVGPTLVVQPVHGAGMARPGDGSANRPVGAATDTLEATQLASLVTHPLLSPDAGTNLGQGKGDGIPAEPTDQPPKLILESAEPHGSATVIDPTRLPGPPVEAVDELQLPRGADLLSDFLPFDRASLELAVDRFLDQLEDLGAGLAWVQDPTGMVSEPILCAAAIAAFEFGRRWLRRSKQEGLDLPEHDQQARTKIDGFSGWPGSWSARVL